MKIRIISTALIISILLCGGSFALGAREYGTVTATVNIKSVFRLSVNRGSIDFAAASLGKTSDSDVGVTVLSSSNTGNNWHLMVSDDKPLNSGRNIIPNRHFSWKGETKGTGRLWATNYSPMETSPAAAYTSTEDEGSNYPEGTRNDFAFRLFVPQDQSPGEYSCSVIFTMTE